VQADATDSRGLDLVAARLQIVIPIRDANDLIRVDAAIKTVSNGDEHWVRAGTMVEPSLGARPSAYERITVTSKLAPSGRID
jgi:hypothetical protein